MNKLIVMYTIDHKNPKNTWSGTSYSLTEALKNFFEVEVVDLYEGFLLRLISKIKEHCFKFFQPFFGTIYDFLLKRKASFLLRKYRGVPVLEIANEVKIRKPYYIYQDLSLAVLNREKDALNNKNINGGGIRNDWSSKELSRKIKVQKRIYDTVEAAFFMGNWVTEGMKELYPELAHKFFFAGGGVNKDFSLDDITLDDKEPIVLFVGIDFLRKGGDLVLKAFNILKENYHSNAKLYIAGPSRFDNDKLEDVYFLGNVSRQELSLILKKSTIFCMPSRFEAYGLAFPEALSFGNLCIGRNCYEMSYFINDKNGKLIEGDNVEKLADFMYDLLEDKKKLQVAIDNIDKVRDYYSWNLVAKRIHDVINKTV